MIQRIIDSKNFLAFVFAAITGMALWFTVPFPEDNVFLQLMAVKAETVFTAIKYSYLIMLFTTPYIGFSILLSLPLYLHAYGQASYRSRATSHLS